jgi:squalene synthase HpnC
VVSPAGGTLEAAYGACLTLARSHYENFPVASRLVPARMRPHVAAIYAFAREADDIADEPGYAADERYRLLDDRLARLHAAVAAAPDPAADPVYAALADTIARFALPVSLFEDLLSAFRQDVSVTRYATWAAVDDYCRRSANPVGRLVLLLAGVRDEAAHRHSDAVCTALQLANFWQDLAVDWSRGRIYVPAEVAAACGADESQLAGLGGSLPAPWRAALRECTARTRALFAAGRPVSEAVRGRLRYELRATWHGGMRILELLEQGGFDPVARRPALGTADAAVIAWRALRP